MGKKEERGMLDKKGKSPAKLKDLQVLKSIQRGCRRVNQANEILKINLIVEIKRKLYGEKGKKVVPKTESSQEEELKKPLIRYFSGYSK